MTLTSTSGHYCLLSQWASSCEERPPPLRLVPHPFAPRTLAGALLAALFLAARTLLHVLSSAFGYFHFFHKAPLRHTGRDSGTMLRRFRQTSSGLFHGRRMAGQVPRLQPCGRATHDWNPADSSPGVSPLLRTYRQSRFADCGKKGITSTSVSRKSRMSRSW